jgi:hypothetical protein
MTTATEREQARARKLRYGGRCEVCGGPTSGCNGRAKAPKVCAKCSPAFYAPRYSAARTGRGPVIAKVLAAIDTPLRVTEIASAVGVSREHAQQVVLVLHGRGLAERVRRGVYVRKAGAA